MKKIKIKSEHRTLLADTLTPIGIYLRLRDVFAGTIMLESSDYHGNENSLSIVCCDPISSFQVKGGKIQIQFPGQEVESETIETRSVLEALDTYRSSFEAESSCGLYGYMCYDAVRFFDDLTINRGDTSIPDIVYKLYRYVIEIDHFSNTLTLTENRDGKSDVESNLDRIEQLISGNRVSTYRFYSDKEEISNVSDEEFIELVKKGIGHCNRGDVFQVVFSRRFACKFKGDEFNVYRALRSINPSPYLFFFDYGSFKLFGSSPEAQLQIKDGRSTLFPIAGTFRRTGNDEEDERAARALAADKKENAEHVMLVDLARNDLSRGAHDVKVDVFKEIQFYSHVIHIVSKVSGSVNGTSPMKIVADTFPAGTLSGAPKHKAVTLINQYENINRGFYGGAIGFLGFNGSFNHAIMIRTFLSSRNQLIYQAGAGVVAKSDPESELKEVNNKLAALRSAIAMAENI